MKHSNPFGLFIVVALVAAIWCTASTVYHAHLLNHQFTYLGNTLSGSQAIAVVWFAWAIGVVFFGSVVYGLGWTARQDRIVDAPEPVRGPYVKAVVSDHVPVLCALEDARALGALVRGISC